MNWMGIHCEIKKTPLSYHAVGLCLTEMVLLDVVNSSWSQTDELMSTRTEKLSARAPEEPLLSCPVCPSKILCPFPGSHYYYYLPTQQLALSIRPKPNWIQNPATPLLLVIACFIHN
jgi:hypothetical protein